MKICKERVIRLSSDSTSFLQEKKWTSDNILNVKYESRTIKLNHEDYVTVNTNITATCKREMA